MYVTHNMQHVPKYCYVENKNPVPAFSFFFRAGSGMGTGARHAAVYSSIGISRKHATVRPRYHSRINSYIIYYRPVPVTILLLLRTVLYLLYSAVDNRGI
jgi:hypothetical protein